MESTDTINADQSTRSASTRIACPTLPSGVCNELHEVARVADNAYEQRLVELILLEDPRFNYGRQRPHDRNEHDASEAEQP